MRLLRVATCNLNQWAMDFDTNLRNVKESIARAKAAGAAVRVGPELELTGYGCEDHFLEQDTTAHAYHLTWFKFFSFSVYCCVSICRWECLKDILTGDYTDNILCSIGMPVIFNSVRYNCQVFCLNRKIIMIRPKMSLANDGNYREFRWFSAWTFKDEIVEFQLPIEVSEAISQDTVPFGYGYIRFLDVSLAAETCEELFTANAPRIDLALNGVEVFMNASGSHHQLRKLNLRIDSIRNATKTCGGVYMYANQQGCDGSRLYYVCFKSFSLDGCCCIAVNGDLVAQGSQFSLKDVEVMNALVDLDAVSSYRASVSSFREQASHRTNVPFVKVPYKLCQSFRSGMIPTSPVQVSCVSPIFEILCMIIVYGIFGYCLCTISERVSGILPVTQQGNLFLSRPSLILQIMYHCPEEEIAFGPSCLLWDYLRRSQASGFLLPLSGGADSSSVAAIVGCMCQLVIKDTRSRAKRLSEEIGSFHLNVPIDSIVSAFLSLFETLTGKRPRYKVDGGSNAENLGLQNIQARSRMVLAFMMASLMPWVHNKSGFYLVLGSSNVDEGLRGYLTKYDCSSADINPIGSVSKQDLRAFLRWAAIHLKYSSLAEVESAPPTAELEPIRANYSQLDEVDMGMTYEELSVYGRLRKIFRCGPVSMFQSYSPEDNRFDLRQFLYNSRWPYQFRKINELVQEMGKDGKWETPAEGLQTAQTGAQGSGMGVVSAGSSNPSAGF
ncbi:hypothetical protein HU200_061269 [Digitaria exilis]|uniref:Glutamine-dependent NAD(+) synthetase n=1 Tax=Digitaria exilis TaxID=1010633 RepID=A0A835E1I6_9POAL|nr:hypothetical protein HU200_061269 [Digitaria exilis]